MVVFQQKLLYSGKSGCIRSKGLFSEKVVVFWQGGSLWVIVVVFGQKLVYSGKSGCIQAKWLYSGEKWLYSGKVVVFGQKMVEFG